jgi:hypothetical protein
MAAQRASELEQGIDKKRTPDKLTVGECVDIYIDSREGLRTDKTVKDYRGYRRNYLQGLMPMRLKALTVQKIQREINLELEEHSPKTVRNAWGLISSALQYENEDLKFPVSLPSADGEEINLIEDEDSTSSFSLEVAMDTENKTFVIKREKKAILFQDRNLHFSFSG